jgi:hypothetical protein
MDAQATTRERARMKYRKLRIAWSVMCGILCLLLIALWVRSYSYLDAIGTPPRVVTSWRGRLFAGGTGHVKHFSDRDESNDPRLRTVLGVYILTAIDQGNIAYKGGSSLPIAAPLILITIVAAAPWIRWRYSLRTLLVAMTVIAMGLGVIVYAMR